MNPRLTTSRRALLLTGLAALALPVAAQNFPGRTVRIIVAQAPGSSADALARGIAGKMAEGWKSPVVVDLGRVAPDKREAAGKAIEAEVRKFHGELETHLKDRATKLAPTVIGAALEEKFSEDELREIVRWQESTAVRRYLQLGGELEKTLGDKLVADTRPAVEPRLRNLEGSIRKIIEQPPAAAGAASAPKAAPKAPAKKP